MRRPTDRRLKAPRHVALAFAFTAGLASLAQAQPAPAPAPASSAPAGASQPAQGTPRVRRAVDWRLDIDAPKDLAELLRDYLDLSRYEAEDNTNDTLRVSRSELRRLVAGTPDQARALLDAEGYFSAQINVRMSEGTDGQPTVVTLTVVPGERTRIRRVQFVYEGELDRLLNDTPPEKRATEVVAALESRWSLGKGDVFRQSAWSSAKNGSLAYLRAEGYPLASWSGTAATVDAEARHADLFLVADSGPAFAFGDIIVQGTVRQPPSAVINLAPFDKGDPYRESLLLDWQERIQKLNLFEAVFVSPVLDPEQAKAAPLIVRVKELPMQAATAGIGASSDTGPRVSLEYTHRNPMDLDWQAKGKVQLGTKLSTGQFDLLSHPWRGGKRGLVSGAANSEEDSFEARNTSQSLRAGLLREGQRLERTDYIEWQHASVRTKSRVLVSDATALSATSQWIYRDVDSRVLPTRGTTTMAQVTAGKTYDAFNREGVFTRLYGRFVGYLPLPANWHFTGRLEAGQVAAPEGVSVPDPLLFRAGGDESVRGYAYRSLGVERDGVVLGGKVIATGSAELAHPLPWLPPAFLGAVFVDVGDASDRFGTLKSYTGYGVGLRWRSPVGALKLDFAHGTSEDKWRIHFTVGVSL